MPTDIGCGGTAGQNLNEDGTSTSSGYRRRMKWNSEFAAAWPRGWRIPTRRAAFSSVTLTGAFAHGELLTAPSERNAVALHARVGSSEVACQFRMTLEKEQVWPTACASPAAQKVAQARFKLPEQAAGVKLSRSHSCRWPQPHRKESRLVQARVMRRV